MKELKDEITTEFPPFCPDCTNRMIWQSDFMLSETGFLPDDTPMSEDRVVHIFACPECDCMATYLDLEDEGKMQLLEVDWNTQEDEDSGVKYTPFAIENYFS